MKFVLDVAQFASNELVKLSFNHSFIGGIALQAWGEPRVTRDVDISVLTYFEKESEKIDQLLAIFKPRIANAKEHALQYRVLLCQSESGIGIDLGLGGFPYEEAMLERSRVVKLAEGVTIPIICAEDLVISKVFAGRPRDWEDIVGILARQSGKLDWDIIDSSLPDLLMAIDSPERLAQLHRIRGDLYDRGI